MDKLVLFAALSGVCTDDPLHRSLLTHCNLSLADLSAVFLQSDQDSSLTADLKAANVAFTAHCYLCNLFGHIAKDFPHADAIACLIA
jgi:hypothetical protein